MQMENNKTTTMHEQDICKQFTAKYLNNLKRWRDRNAYKVQLYFHEHWRFIPHPSRRYALESDAQFNDEASRDVQLSDEANIETQCCWAVEVFTPSHMPRLREALKKLNLDEDVISYEGQHSKRISAQRESANRGGSASLGYIVRSANTYLFPKYAVGPLPPSVKFASLQLHLISPSITALTVCFFLNETSSGAYLEILRRKYDPKFHSYGRAYTIKHSPEIKEEEIENNRGNLRIELAEWFRSNIPGIFSACDNEFFPMIEMLLIENEKISTNLENILGTPEHFRNKSTDWPGVSLSWPEGRRRGRTTHGVLLAESARLAQYDTRGYGDDRDKYPYVFDHQIRAFAVLWSLLALIRALRARLSRLRDSNFGLERKNTKKILHSLQLMTLESVDISSISYDLSKISQNHVFIGGFADFEASGSREDTPKKKVSPHLIESIQSEAVELERLDDSVKARVMQQGTLLAAAQNIRLQRVVNCLTVIALILAAVSAWQPAKQLWDLAGCGLKGGHMTAGTKPICEITKR